jgi:Ca2+-binding RTX toxin-like protein
VYGGLDNDLLVGEAGNDQIFGGKGNDGAYGGGGHDQMFGETGNDVFFGDGGNDYLNGGEGDDVLRGGAGNDGLEGDVGNDKLIGGAGVDKMTGGEGRDTFVWTIADAFLKGSKPLDTMDYVTDFGKEDVLDLSGMFSKMSADEALQHIKMEDTGEGTVIVVDAGLGGDWSKVAMLIDFHISEPKELWANDMLII